MLSKLHNTFVTLMLHADKDTAHVSRDRETCVFAYGSMIKVGFIQAEGLD